MFGFDTAVISGAEGAIQDEWGLSDALIGQVVAMALYGTILGALLGGLPADRFGRKTTLIGVAVLYLISAGGSALATDVVQLNIFRFLGGIGVGASSVVAPMYITEVAPAKLRGRLVAAFQLNLVVGILIAYFTNYLIVDLSGAINWRLMLGIEVVPALFFLAMIFTVPRSPRWLVTKAGLSQEALTILQRIDPATAKQELVRIEASDTTRETVALGAFFSGKYRRPILYAFLFAFFNQVSGINAIIYYAPRVFEAAKLGTESAFLSTVGIGVVNVVFTFLGMYLIDRSGRKTLMYIGSIGYIVSLSAVSWAFFTDNLEGLIVPGWLFVFIASHAIGQGAVIWVFLSEIFGNEVRGLGASLGSGTHWVFAALIGGNFPALAGWFGQGPIFALFAICMVGQLLWVHFVMPETRGVELEVLQAELTKT